MRKITRYLLICLLIVAGFIYLKERSPNINGDNPTWLYQLQDLDVSRVAESGNSIVVMDPTKDGTDETRYTSYDIALLKSAGIRPIAYLSIGEASFFRSYWKEEWGHFENSAIMISPDAPSWSGRIPNPNWPESVKVRYWEDEWWETIQVELEKIQDAGFDGVYLDIVDAFEYWGESDTYGVNRETRLVSDPADMQSSADRMIDFIGEIAHYTRNSNSSFLIIPQNAENILAYDDGRYLQTVDGISVEDTWFNEKQKIGQEIIKERLDFLARYKEAGKFVLSIDYVDDGTGYQGSNRKRMDDYLQKCWQRGFRCTIGRTDRELDRMNSLP